MRRRLYGRVLILPVVLLSGSNSVEGSSSAASYLSSSREADGVDPDPSSLLERHFEPPSSSATKSTMSSSVPLRHATEEDIVDLVAEEEDSGEEPSLFNVDEDGPSDRDLVALRSGTSSDHDHEADGGRTSSSVLQMSGREDVHRLQAEVQRLRNELAEAHRARVLDRQLSRRAGQLNRIHRFAGEDQQGAPLGGAGREQELLGGSEDDLVESDRGSGLWNDDEEDTAGQSSSPSVADSAFVDEAESATEGEATMDESFVEEGESATEGEATAQTGFIPVLGNMMTGAMNTVTNMFGKRVLFATRGGQVVCDEFLRSVRGNGLCAHRRGRPSWNGFNLFQRQL